MSKNLAQLVPSDEGKQWMIPAVIPGNTYTISFDISVGWRERLRILFTGSTKVSFQMRTEVVAVPQGKP